MIEQTYRELLSAMSNGPCQNNEFIEINKQKMIWTNLDEEDYGYFWGCMKLYDVLGVNYFESYLELITQQYGDFSGDIELWLRGMGQSMNSWNTAENAGYFHYLEALMELFEALRFFEIDNYGGRSISELDDMLKNASKSAKAAHQKVLQQSLEKRQQTIDSKVSNYFNFDNFSESEFTNFVNLCTIKRRNKKAMSIDDALKLARDAEQRTYIVIFSCNGEVCSVGKTEQPLAYIGNRHKKYGADSAAFEVVDEAYVDDVLLATMIFYDLPLERVRTTLKNRKYATIKQACFAYRVLESLPRKRILNAIENGKLRVIDLGNEQELIDKIELERALRH